MIVEVCHLIAPEWMNTLLVGLRDDGSGGLDVASVVDHRQVKKFGDCEVLVCLRNDSVKLLCRGLYEVKEQLHKKFI
jgi:hypothetical protein